MSTSRTLSLIVAATYVLIAYLAGEASTGFRSVVGVSVLLGLLGIWFGDELGGIRKLFCHTEIIYPPAGNTVRFLGWIILVFLPILAFILREVYY